MMRCTKCNGLYVQRWDVEFQQEEVVCINCGAMPLQEVIPEPPPHGPVKDRRGLADDPFYCACGISKDQERARCKPCNMKLNYEWRKKVDEMRSKKGKAARMEKVA